MPGTVRAQGPPGRKSALHRVQNAPVARVAHIVDVNRAQNTELACSSLDRSNAAASTQKARPGEPDERLHEIMTTSGRPAVPHLSQQFALDR